MYRVEISNKEGYRFNIKSKDYEFKIDVNGSGITPPDTLLASLGSCACALELGLDPPSFTW